MIKIISFHSFHVMFCFLPHSESELLHAGRVSLSHTRALQQSGRLLTMQFELQSSGSRTHSLWPQGPRAALDNSRLKNTSMWLTFTSVSQYILRKTHDKPSQEPAWCTWFCFCLFGTLKTHFSFFCISVTLYDNDRCWTVKKHSKWDALR